MTDRQPVERCEVRCTCHEDPSRIARLVLANLRGLRASPGVTLPQRKPSLARRFRALLRRIFG